MTEIKIVTLAKQANAETYQTIEEVLQVEFLKYKMDIKSVHYEGDSNKLKVWLVDFQVLDSIGGLKIF